MVISVTTSSRRNRGCFVNQQIIIWIATTTRERDEDEEREVLFINYAVILMQTNGQLVRHFQKLCNLRICWKWAKRFHGILHAYINSAEDQLLRCVLLPRTPYCRRTLGWTQVIYQICVRHKATPRSSLNWMWLKVRVKQFPISFGYEHELKLCVKWKWSAAY